MNNVFQYSNYAKQLQCQVTRRSTHLDEQQHVQKLGLPLAVLLPQNQHVQQAGSHTLTHLGQTSLQLRHRVHPALAVLHHLREEQGEGAHTHIGFGSAQRSVQYGRLASGEANLHDCVEVTLRWDKDGENLEQSEAINTSCATLR